MSPSRKIRNSSRGNSAPDSLNPLGDGADRKLGGAAFAEPVNRIERGTIINVDANRHVYRVALNSGRVMVMGRLKTHPGDSTLLPNRTPVRVSFALGLPYIDGVLPSETRAPDDRRNPASITDVPGHGGDDPAFSRNLGASARADGEPSDVMPGDFVGQGPDGASVAALHGRVAQLKASPLAQLQAFGDTDTVRIAAGLYQLVTWMGESRVVNDDGKTSFIWRGGSDQLTQTGADEERYTLKLDVGHTGDVLRFEVSNREGQPVFRLHVSPEGRVDVFAAGGVSTHGGNGTQRHPRVTQGSSEEVVTGATSRVVERDASTTVRGGLEHSVGSSRNYVTGLDFTSRINRNFLQNVGGTKVEVVGGDSTYHVGGTYEHVTSGELHAVKVETGSYRLEISAGNATFDLGRGSFTVQTAGADTIRLGQTARSHLVKWEELAAALGPILARVNVLSAALATHTHVLSIPPGTTGTSPMMAATAATLPVDISAAKTQKIVGE